MLLLLASLSAAADTVDLTRQDYALRLAPKYLKGERPGHPIEPCLMEIKAAESLSRAQNTLRLREYYLRIHECGGLSAEITLEDRTGHAPADAARTLSAALQAEGWKADPASPRRWVRGPDAPHPS